MEGGHDRPRGIRIGAQGAQQRRAKIEIGGRENDIRDAGLANFSAARRCWSPPSAGFRAAARRAALPPAGHRPRRRHFFEIWTGGQDWERVKILGRDCPRISAEFLAQERRELGPLLFSQEYEGEFIDAQSSAFSSEMIELALTDDFERFIQ